MFIVLLGPPGVGKGTQCRRMAAELRVPHISTGDMLRQAIESDTPLGREVAELIALGRLVPDSVVLDIVAERLELPDCHDGCLFDGFPRTLAQAEGLDRLLARQYRPLDLAIELRGDDEALMQRMLRRAKLENRADDTPTTIRERMRIYHRQTEPLVAYYARNYLLRTVDAMGTPDEVFDRISVVLRQQRTSAAYSI